MSKKVSVSYRLSKESLKKIEVIRDYLEDKNRRIGLEEKVKNTDIVESAIEMYYLNVIDSTAGDPYLTKMKAVIKDELKSSFDVFIANLNSSRFDTMKILEFIKFLVSQLDVTTDDNKILKDIKSVKSIEEVIEGDIYSSLMKKNEVEN